MIEIIPAVMPKNVHDLKEKLERVVGAVPMVQIDIMDGKFTPSRSWPYQKKEDVFFDKLLGEEEGLPFWEKLNFEIDLMVQNPTEVVDAWIAAGAERIIVHIESTDAVGAIKTLREKFPKGDPVGIEVCVAIGIETPIESLAPIIDDVESIQCMGIARIGFQGEPFDERVLQKVIQLREYYPEHIISIDGGVSLDTAKALLDAGATRLVSGSAIFESDNIRATVREFESL